MPLVLLAAIITGFFFLSAAKAENCGSPLFCENGKIQSTGTVNYHGESYDYKAYIYKETGSDGKKKMSGVEFFDSTQTLVALVKRAETFLLCTDHGTRSGICSGLFDKFKQQEFVL